MKVARILPEGTQGKHRSLIAMDLAEAPYFRAVLGLCLVEGEDEAGVDAATVAHLGLKLGDEVWALELE